MTGKMTAVLFLALIVAMFASAAQAQTVTLRNEEYGYEITVPEKWKPRKILQADPDETLKSKEFSFAVSTGPGDPEPKNWNGVEFNNEGRSSDEDPPPVVVVFAHRKGDQTPAQFAALFEPVIEMWRGKFVNKTKTESGLDYTYDLFAKVRYVVRYDKGNRYIIQYMVPSRDPKWFDQYAPEFDAVVKSLKTF